MEPLFHQGLILIQILILYFSLKRYRSKSFYCLKFLLCPPVLHDPLNREKNWMGCVVSLLCFYLRFLFFPRILFLSLSYFLSVSQLFFLSPWFLNVKNEKWRIRKHNTLGPGYMSKYKIQGRPTLVIALTHYLYWLSERITRLQ